MTVYVHWALLRISFIEEYYVVHSSQENDFNSGKKVIEETDKIVLIPVAWKEKLEESDLLAMAIQRWVACYDEKGAFDLDRYSRHLGNIKIKDVDLCTVEIVEKEALSLLDLTINDPNSYRSRI